LIAVRHFPTVREYGFELRLSAHLETEDRLVARQLGGAVHGRRIVDVVCLDPGPTFGDRAAITPATIPPRAVESDVGPGRPTPVRDAFACHPQTAAETIEDAVEAGFFERTRHEGQPAVRQTVRYPDDWFDALVGIECKPDLGRPGALETQLLTDAHLGLFDRVVLATASHVTGAHLNRIPEAVGVWVFEPETGERSVVREPVALPTDEPGVEIVERRPGRTDIAVVAPDEKARLRRRVAERAYGKGWRPTALPGCARADPDADGAVHCRHHDRLVHPPSDCGPSCSGYEPGEPTAIDREGRRADASPWEPDPPGRRRTQASIDRF
jgi:hypothetical protein